MTDAPPTPDLIRHRGGPPPLEAGLSRVLLGGVYLAAAVGLMGGAFYLWKHGSEQRSYSEFLGEPSLLTRPLSIVRSAAAMEPAAVVQLAILILIATPVLRVALSLVLFVAKRDGLYVVITLIVLAALVGGLWGELG